METYFIKQEDIFRFYERIEEEFNLYVPVRIESPPRVKCEFQFSLPSDDYILKRYPRAAKEEIVFNEYRCIEPLRSFFVQAKEEVCAYFSAPDSDRPRQKEKPPAICGVKNCDIFSLKVQDFVFLEGVEPDPLYKKRREEALVISGDCPAFKEACFCRAFDINPHPEEGFDFNLSPLNNGYLLDIATAKAKAVAGSLKEILTPATLGQLSGRAAKRDSVMKRLQEHLERHCIPKKAVLQDIVLSGYSSQVWSEQMRTCVECGGCVFMCDTCHCFLLADEKRERDSGRLRLWDGCLFKNFTKVAGGANPLRMRYMRLRNRYLKKFDFFVDNLGYQACCGCGRCIEVCPGRIDIRYILKRLYEEKHLSAR